MKESRLDSYELEQEPRMISCEFGHKLLVSVWDIKFTDYWETISFSRKTAPNSLLISK